MNIPDQPSKVIPSATLTVEKSFFAGSELPFSTIAP